MCYRNRSFLKPVINHLPDASSEWRDTTERPGRCHPPHVVCTFPTPLLLRVAGFRREDRLCRRAHRRLFARAVCGEFCRNAQKIRHDRLPTQPERDSQRFICKNNCGDSFWKKYKKILHCHLFIGVFSRLNDLHSFSVIFKSFAASAVFKLMHLRIASIK